MSRERLGVPRDVVYVGDDGDFDIVALRCGHWFRAHHGFAETTAGCPACESLERLSALLETKTWSTFFAATVPYQGPAERLAAMDVER